MGRLLYRRCFHVGHSRDGFRLGVWDRFVPGIVAEGLVGGILAALGHPCCERGLLGRSDLVALAAFKFLNLPNRLARRDRLVVEILISPEQAVTIEPQWARETWALVADEEATEVLNRARES